MASGIEELIDMLYEMVTEAWNVPFGGDKCVIERERLLDVIDEIKAKMPKELEEAQKLMASRTEYIEAAKREADTIKRVAEEHANKLVEEEEILRIARQRSKEVVIEADTKSRELRKAANEYADDALRRTEEAINTALSEVRQSRIKFRSAAGAANIVKPQQNYNAES